MDVHFHRQAEAKNRLGRRLVAAERFSRAKRAHGVRVRPLRAEKPAWQRGIGDVKRFQWRATRPLPGWPPTA